MGAVGDSRPAQTDAFPAPPGEPPRPLAAVLDPAVLNPADGPSTPPAYRPAYPPSPARKADATLLASTCNAGFGIDRATCLVRGVGETCGLRPVDDIDVLVHALWLLANVVSRAFRPAMETLKAMIGAVLRTMRARAVEPDVQRLGMWTLIKLCTTTRGRSFQHGFSNAAQAIIRRTSGVEVVVAAMRTFRDDEERIAKRITQYGAFLVDLLGWSTLQERIDIAACAASLWRAS